MTALVLLAAGVTGTATAESRQAGHGSVPTWRGTIVRLAALPSALRLAGSGPSWRIWYLSTGWNNRPTVVSGTLSVPKGSAPAGGWPIVSFGHGFSGLADACAQSRTGPSPWERTLEETLIGAGYAVAVTDWEGTGTPGDSPGIEGHSEAYTTIDIVRAARHLAGLSRTWLSIGYSQGGHAALWASSLASAYAPELRLAGTIALAPVTQLGLLVTVAQDPAAPLNPTVPYGGRAFTVTHSDFRPARWFTPRGLDLVDLAGRVCIDEMAATVAGVTNADALRDPPAAAAEFGRLYAPEEVPLTGYTRPVRILHGAADTLPMIFSQITAGQLAGAGVDATFEPVEGADHFTLLPTVAAKVVLIAHDLLAS
ncbi:hypothetical protein J5X84_16810 [Streptosporangiaceae bacterium NEAU-GS5]|nr:hypothetical protein [Streptosporangiaceae bacterium NEAU-GS5]